MNSFKEAYDFIHKTQKYKQFVNLKEAGREKYTGIGFIVDWNCVIFWCLNGFYHRLDGPAILFSSGASSRYFIHGVPCNEEQFWNRFEVIEHKLNSILNQTI